jgi:hypothetical protein
MVLYKMFVCVLMDNSIDDDRQQLLCFKRGFETEKISNIVGRSVVVIIV